GLLRGLHLGLGHARGVAGRLDRADEGVRGHELGLELDRRLLGRVVHRRRHAVELVQPALDPRRARRARHPFDRKVEPRAHRSTSSVNGAVWTTPSTLNWRKSRYWPALGRSVSNEISPGAPSACGCTWE